VIIPSIDLMAGRAVQLRRGRELVLTAEQAPVELARRFAFYAQVAVVDLDAALGRGTNRDLVRELCRHAPCRVGGGIRTEEDVVDLIKSGATQAVIGTAATPEFLGRFPRDWVHVALDSRGGTVTDHGWTSDTGESVLARARRLEPHCSGFLFTQVDVEGTLGGVPLEPVRALAGSVNVPVTVAGGVADLSDVRGIERLGCDVQIGMALYRGLLSLDDALLALPAFDTGPIPTVAQAPDGRVLMLAWSTRDSLREALALRRGVYWSRSRQAIWRKGDTSGHTQTLLGVRYDCDADALLFTVDQQGAACHTNRSTCFGDVPSFRLEDLARIVASRRDGDRGTSWTARLLSDPALLRKKILEEATEVCEAETRSHLTWELADLFYHAMVLMEARGIGIREIEAELRGRHR
jgi:phosphoribosyl-ATP pyrophosphohydrolase/phosphoribosyl-AMP cyclohydrolase